ncbi:hypothetical protein SLEP1_g51659 [Rubroshorea leprosula]|uniref:Uncharacterized protein n=1 Tax=Rubroshorea leprosula TaxID=152421 RepID=A0AAV5M423_9ROSI|nr:hypothetical protein SLEP1_g51659 [Rubroshorea leprosula]
MDQKKEVEIRRENPVVTKTKLIVVTEGGIMIKGTETVTGTMIENVVRIMSALRLMILDVATGHIQGLRSIPGIMIVTETLMVKGNHLVLHL